MNYMRTFGEMAVVAIHKRKKMRSKLDNRGKHVCLLDMQRIMLVMYSIQIPEYPYNKNYHEQRCEMVEHNMETLQNESIYARKQVDLFRDEEERSIEKEKSVEEDSVEEEEETEGVGNNTPKQKRLGLDISSSNQNKAGQTDGHSD